MGRFFYRNGWFIVLISLLLLFPQALTSQARLNNRVLITGLAIDKVSEGFEVTAQVVMPTAGSQARGEGASLDFITERGASIADGLKKIAYNIGEVAGLSHTNFIIIGSNMFGDDIDNDLNYFLRDQQIPTSVMVVFANGSAKEQLKRTGNLEISVGLGLQKVYLYKQESLSSKMVTLQEFLDSSYDPAHISILPEFNISLEGEEEETGDSSTQSIGIILGNESGAAGSSSGSSGGGEGDGGSSSSSGDKNDGGSSSSSSGSSGGSGSSGESASPKQGRIKFFTPLAYFKNGRFKGVLTSRENIASYLLAQSTGRYFDLVINNVNDGEIYHSATVSIRISSKKENWSVDFSNGKPVANLNLRLRDIKIMEINNEAGNYEGSYSFNKPYINQTLRSAIKEQLENNIIEVFNKTKAENIDIFSVANIAYRYNNVEWQNYLKTLTNIDDYLSNIDFQVNVIVEKFV